MKKILLVVFLWLVFLLIINKVSTRFLTDHTSYELPKKYTITHRFWFVPWLNFDGRNYLKITISGYQESANKKFNLRVFFPFYPLVIRILSLNLLINPVYVGLLVSIMSFILSLVILNALLTEDKSKEETRIKVLQLMILFPASFYFASFYTESLFLLLTLLTFFFLKKRNFLLASLFTAMAGATKLLGLALLPVLIYDGYQSFKSTKKIPLSLLIAPLGIVSYIIYTQATDKHGLAVVIGHSDWGRRIGLLSPFLAFKDSLTHVLFGSTVSRFNYLARSIEVTELATALFLLIIVVLSFRKIKISYWLYLFFGSLLIFFSGTFISIMRIIIVFFPIHIYLGQYLSPKANYLVGAIFLILFIYLASLFLRGYWVA